MQGGALGHSRVHPHTITIISVPVPVPDIDAMQFVV